MLIFIIIFLSVFIVQKAATVSKGIISLCLSATHTHTYKKNTIFWTSVNHSGASESLISQTAVHEYQMQPNWLPNLFNNQYFFNYSYLWPKVFTQGLADSWPACWATGQTQRTLFITLTAKLSLLHFIIGATVDGELSWAPGKRNKTEEDSLLGCEREQVSNMNINVKETQPQWTQWFLESEIKRRSSDVMNSTSVFNLILFISSHLPAFKH